MEAEVEVAATKICCTALGAKRGMRLNQKDVVVAAWPRDDDRSAESEKAIVTKEVGKPQM